MWEAIGAASQPMLGFWSSVLGPIKPGLTPIVYPSGVDTKHAATSIDQLNKLVTSLHLKKLAWANLSPVDKASLFRECIDTTLEATEDAAQLMAKAKGQYGNGLGEERSLLITPVVALREYAEALEAGGQPKPKKIYKRPDGQSVVEVLPKGLEAMFFGGYKGEVWIEPGKEASQGKAYRELAEGKTAEGSVALVLGAGNQISVLLMDVMHMLVAKNAVVICKSNPVLDYLGPYIEKALEPLVKAGYVAFAYGGAKEGAFLGKHELIDAVHLTGSAATYDAIVWGSNKAKSGEPSMKKHVTAELGCVTPYIIVPGNWSKRAIAYWADECVAGLVNNSGHNCTKLEVLITAADWPLRESFVQAVRERLDSIPRRVAWYPGSNKRYSDFKAKFQGAEELGHVGSQPPATCQPWLFKAGLTPDQADTETENWCGVCQEVGLPGLASDPSKFLEAAVKYANDRCWGSLSCTIVSPPETDAAALDKAVAGLKYGAVGINIPSFVAYSFPKLSWGAYPGNDPKDIGSGIGSVHNTLLFDNVQKSVLYSSWIHHPTHLWSPQVRNLDATTYYAQRFLAYPSLFSLTSTAVSALRG